MLRWFRLTACIETNALGPSPLQDFVVKYSVMFALNKGNRLTGPDQNNGAAHPQTCNCGQWPRLTEVVRP